MSKNKPKKAHFKLCGGHGCYYLFQKQSERAKISFLRSNVIEPRLKHYKLYE